MKYRQTPGACKPYHCEDGSGRVPCCKTIKLMDAACLITYFRGMEKVRRPARQDIAG